MGTVHSSTVVTVSGGFFISTNLIIFKEQWLTLGITASNSSSGTCTTLMVTVPWTRTTLSVWPFATPSSKARETSIKPLSRRTRRSWLTCGTRSLSWLTSTRTMAYSWDNRVKFVVRYMYDIDGNGSLDKNDFECLAVRNTVIEGKGDFDQATFKKNQEVMANLWNEIAELADFNKDGEISSEEFKKGIEKSAKGKSFADLPAAFKFFIDAQFRTIDVDGDG